jgi:hypothetical protein
MFIQVIKTNLGGAPWDSGYGLDELISCQLNIYFLKKSNLEMIFLHVIQARNKSIRSCQIKPVTIIYG